MEKKKQKLKKFFFSFQINLFKFSYFSLSCMFKLYIYINSKILINLKLDFILFFLKHKKEKKTKKDFNKIK